MLLYIVRHAIAEDRDLFAKKNPEDSLRPLTMKGKKRMRKIIQGIKRELAEIELIVTSPFLRAKQTANLISEMIGKIQIVESAELVPQAPPQAIIKWLKMEGIKHKKILIVGHEPHLSSLASLLLSGKSEGRFIEFKKSSIALIETGNFSELTPSRASLLWLLSPKMR
ncbi:MAG: phosphohistidine phosphatase SixA [Deltaproteobacteria bacterium]|jgi:phosphohistidine phosphatase|nr:phosphohistidine phosphatase SixA [Deltaproteobacteria bacterium]